MLTRKQRDLLNFIQAKTQENNGVCPSFEEMRSHMQLKSKSGIHRLVLALEQRGFVRRIPHCARAIEVIKAPSQMTAPSAQVAPSQAA